MGGTDGERGCRAAGRGWFFRAPRPLLLMLDMTLCQGESRTTRTATERGWPRHASVEAHISADALDEALRTDNPRGAAQRDVRCWASPGHGVEQRSRVPPCRGLHIAEGSRVTGNAPGSERPPRTTPRPNAWAQVPTGMPMFAQVRGALRGSCAAPADGGDGRLGRVSKSVVGCGSV